MTRIWKENLAYKDMLRLKDAMDILALHSVEDAFVAVRNFLLEADSFAAENCTDRELQQLVKIDKAIGEGKTVLVLVRGNWYQVSIVLPTEKQVVLKQRVVEATDNPFADHIFINEVRKVIVDQA